MSGLALFAADLGTLGKDAEGIFMVQAWSDDADLKSKYAAKFGSAPDGVTLGYAAIGWDTVNCLQAKAEPFLSTSIKSALLAGSCRGLTGETKFTGERIAQRRKPILKIAGGQFTPAE